MMPFDLSMFSDLSFGLAALALLGLTIKLGFKTITENTKAHNRLALALEKFTVMSVANNKVLSDDLDDVKRMVTEIHLEILSNKLKG